MRRRRDRRIARREVLTAIPDDTPPRTNLFLRPGEPVDVAGLGLCYPIRTRVVAVRPDSPAAKAGLKPKAT